MLTDVTRVLLLDETQGRNFADMMPSLLRSLGRKLASENYSVSFSTVFHAEMQADESKRESRVRGERRERHQRVVPRVYSLCFNEDCNMAVKTSVYDIRYSVGIKDTLLPLMAANVEYPFTSISKTGLGQRGGNSLNE